MRLKRYYFATACAFMLSIAGTAEAQPPPPVLSTVTVGNLVTLSWPGVPGATGYTLNYAPRPYTGPASIVSVDMGTKNTVSYEIPAGAAYFGAVQSSDSSGASPYSNIVEVIMPSYPIAADVFTTRQRTVVPDKADLGLDLIFPWQVSLFKDYGYGTWHFGAGLDAVKRLDIMPSGYPTTTPALNYARLLNFFTITDIHISDKESPSQVMFLADLSLGLLELPVGSTYSPVMLYTTQVLDAAVQTVNALHKKNPFNFGISLGDAINNTQYNELRAYLDVLDGNVLTPSSGDHAGADTIDYQKTYQPAGLDKTISWYQALGNHDHFFIGTYPVAPNPKLKDSYTSSEILQLGNVFLDPIYGITKPYYYMGTIDGSTPYGDVIGAGCAEINLSLECASAISPVTVVADPDRRSLTRKEWMNEFFTTSSNPVGHGFKLTDNVDADFASYSFLPNPDVPIKVIVLDDTQVDSDANLLESPLYGHTSIDQQRLTWLEGELDSGQANGQLMIIAAHAPIGVSPECPSPQTNPLTTCSSGWYPGAVISQAAFIAKLHEYPNLILWISGHRHVNVVTAFPSPDPATPENGFWQVETASLRDFPQTLRTFEIVRNLDKTISIFATDVNPAVRDGSPAATSRSYSVAAQQLFKNPLPDTTTHVGTVGSPSYSISLPVEPLTGMYNAELVKQLTPEMQAVIGNKGTSLH